MPSKLSQAEYNERKGKLLIGFHWCSKCKQYLELESFSKSKSAEFGYYWWCKSCHSKNRKGNNYVKGKARQYNRELKSYYKHLAGGKCAKCGYDKTQAALEFHHVNPENKESTVAQIINSGIHNDIVHEMEKCILLCRNCHQEFGAYCWIAEFVKNDEGIGYKIKPGSVNENVNEFWTEPSDKILYSQQTFFDGKAI